LTRDSSQGHTDSGMKLSIFLVLVGAAISLAQVCRDHSSYCSMLASFGFCRADRQRMMEQCPKSCGFCGDIRPPTDSPITRRPVTNHPGTGIKTQPAGAQCGKSFYQESRIIAGEKAKKICGLGRLVSITMANSFVVDQLFLPNGY